MSLINIEHLTFGYPGSLEDVFEDVSFQLDTNWKLGFIGRNGRGKTTFFRLLQGLEEYRGKIQASVTFDYFPYPVKDKEQTVLKILEEIAPEAEEWEFERELSYLEVREGILDRTFSTLSNGEQTKVLLSALFLNPGHFLLIDEPTNHLDAKARKAVALYLKRKKGFILVSHDRSFLDDCVDHILSINKKTIEIQTGNYSSYKGNFDARQENGRSRNEKLKKEISGLKESARRSSDWANKTESAKYGNGPVDRGYIGHKAAKMMKRSKNIETRKEKAIDEKSSLLKDFEESESLKLSPLTFHSDILGTFKEVSPTYDGEGISIPVSFVVKQGDRIALTGENGSGKSSLLKLWLDEGIAYSGSFERGRSLKISYVAQDTSFLKGTLKEFIEQTKIDETLFKAILRKMGFARVTFEGRLEGYSEGQKKKVLLAKSLCEQAHLYLWDEPLNYLDIDSRIQIEDLILDYRPTMIFVEHDDTFREKIATKTIEIQAKE